ncbi:MAG TPA: hypothetical protein VMZ71_15535 [Gemmataceae bacterium]|nr:hypothetical protein [Gemmataceae bacterium]
MNFVLLLPLVLLAAPQPPDEAAELRAIETLRQKLPDARKGELGERLAKLKDPVEGFRTLIGYAAEQDIEGAYDHAAYDAYLAAFRKLRPDHPDGFYFAALRASGVGKHAEAFDLYKTTLEKAPAAEREKYLEPCVRGMAIHGKELETYEAVPPADRGVTFRLLSEKLYGGLFLFHHVEVGVKEARQRLDRLVERHATVVPADPRPMLVRGQLKQQDREWATAEEWYAKFLAATRKADNLTGWATAFYGRVDVAFHRGRGLAIYRELAPTVDATTGKAVFERLEEQYEKARDAAGYKALLAEHESRQPADPDLLYFRGMAFWVAKDYSKAADEFRKYLEPWWAAKGMGKGKRPRYGGYGFNSRGAPERLVRALVRADRGAEVAAVVAKMTALEASFHWFRVTAAAAAGDVAGTRRAVEASAKGQQGGPNLATFYCDADLGPILRSAALAAFRATYPESPGLFPNPKD